MKKFKKRKNSDPLPLKIAMWFKRMWKRINWKKLFRRSSRQVFRNTVINADGKNIKASIYISKTAETLAVAFPIKGKGQAYSKNYHKRELTKAFKKDHVKGLKNYGADLFKKAGVSKKYKKAVKNKK